MAESVPPPLVMLQVTPAFNVVSPVTVTVNVWEAPAIITTGVVVLVTAIGVRVTVKDVTLEVSLLLVAVITAVAVVTGVGAV
jgi:hypothetical protein